MVEVKNVEVFNLKRAQKAIENSFNVGDINTTKGDVKEKLAKSLGNNMQPHQCHDSWLKGILVTFDIKGNGVFMPEFQRYHHHEIVMSQSTMHSMEKFMSGEHSPFTKYVDQRIIEIIKEKYNIWHGLKEEFSEYQKDVSAIRAPSVTEDYERQIYEAFESMVHSLPRGFELWATANSNYLQLKTMVIQRFHHKNVEDWKAFVKACYDMPDFRELCGFSSDDWSLENW